MSWEKEIQKIKKKKKKNDKEHLFTQALPYSLHFHMWQPKSLHKHIICTSRWCSFKTSDYKSWF